MNERVIVLETEGIVIGKDGGAAIVEIQRVSACTGNCRDCAGCETKKMCVTALAETEVSVGDYVKVSTENRSVLFGMFVVFLLPLFLPVLAYAVTFKTGFGGWFALFAFALSLILIWLLSRSHWYLKITQPKIIEVISEKRGKV